MQLYEMFLDQMVYVGLEALIAVTENSAVIWRINSM
jgi:hypothetical protein